MSLPTRLRSFVRSLLHRDSLEDEMQSEVRFHMESRAAHLESTGLSPAQAMRQARIEFGPVATHKDHMRRELGLRWFDELRADLSYAVRMLRRSPGFVLVAVGSLALGIGANTVIFSLAKGVLLDRLAVDKPQELRLLAILKGEQSPIHSNWGNFYPSEDGRTHSTSISYPVYELLRQQNRANPVLGDLFAFKDLGSFKRLTATVDGQPSVVKGELVSGNFYQGLNVHVALGRAIQPTDDAVAGSGTVAVISDELWTREFGRSPSVIGKTIQLNLIPVTIIGVNPVGFTGASSVQESPDIFLPFSMQPVLVPWRTGSLLSDKDTYWLQVMGRALPGVSDAKAQAAMQVWLDQDIRSTMKVKQDDQMPELRVEDGSKGLASASQTYSKAIYVLSALAGFVLLLACANLANLLLARSSARQRELAVRIAMGATRRRVMRQMLTESLLLSTLGGLMGLLLGYLCRNLIPRLLSSSWEPMPLNTSFDLRIFAFTAAISIATGILFGLAPAWQATRTEVNSGLKAAAPSATRRRKGMAGRSLVVFQVALSMVLVAGAGLFIRTLINLNMTNLGFDPKDLLLFSIQAPSSRYPTPKDIALHEQIEDRIAEIPGVQSVTLTAEPILANSMSDTDFIPTGQKALPGTDSYADVNDVGRDFFRTYRIPILYGRSFSSTDTATSFPVAVVNQAIVKRYYASENPIGKTFKGDNDRVYRIIGVAADAKYDRLRNDVPRTFYTLYNQSTDDAVMNYAVKTQMPINDLLPRIRAAVQQIDKDIPLRDIRTQQEQIDATVMEERLFATLTGSFGLLALTLACIGIYGTMAYNVARRTREIGVRIALGAKTERVLAMVLRESVWMATLGIALGVTGAFGLTRFVASMLFGLKPMDPITMAGAGVVLFAVALAAGYGPARRASRIDPMVALRNE
jgi:predicted permease